MDDLKDQIRTYYESTTVPIDIDAIAVDEGTVVVGPFPDAVQRRSAMQTITSTPPPTQTPPPRTRWKGPRLAAAAFAATVVASIAAFAVFGLLNPSPEVLGSADDPAVTIQAYAAATNADDLDAVLTLFTEESVIVNHPRLPSAPMAGLDAIRVDHMTELPSTASFTISNVSVLGDTVTWDAVSVKESGVEWCGEGHSAVVIDGKILSWTWPTIHFCP
jgi:hypothetical protein